MNINNFSFKAALETMDYVPVISTVKNLGDIFAKAVWKPDLETLSVHAKTYYEHIIDKSYLRCVLLLIPAIGNLVVWAIDLEKETEEQAIEKNEAVCEKIKSDIETALLHGGESVSGAGSSDDLFFNATFSYEILIKNQAVMDADWLTTQRLGIKFAVENLHEQYGKEALDCYQVLNQEGNVIVRFPSVPKKNILRMFQTGPHNRPVIAVHN